MKLPFANIAERFLDTQRLSSGTEAHLDHLSSLISRAVAAGDDEAGKRALRRLEWMAENLAGAGLQATAWSHVASAHWDLGHAEQAVENYRKAQAVYESISFPSGKYHSMRCTGSILLAKGEVDEGEQLLLDCIEKFTGLNEPVQVALCWLHLARASSEQMDNVRSAERATKALELFDANDRPDGAIQALAYIASSQVGLENATAAKRLAQDLLARSIKEGVPKWLQDAELLMAHFELEAGELATAEVHLENGLRIARTEKDADAVLLAANVLWWNLNTGRSLKLIEEVERMVSSAENKSSKASALVAKGYILVHSGSISQGEAALREALSLCEASGDSQAVAYCKNNLADARRFHGDWRAACILYGESLSLKRQKHDEWGAAYSLEGLAECAARLGHGKSAVKLLEGADEIRLRLGSPIERPLRKQLEAIRDAVKSAIGEDDAPKLNLRQTSALISWAADQGAAMGRGEALVE
jgi:tetratricopeptide (TPR) repeat protein